MGQKNIVIIIVPLVLLLYSQYYYDMFSTQELSKYLAARIADNQFNIGQQEEADDDTVFVRKKKIRTSLPELVKPSTANPTCPEDTYPIEQVHDREADEGKGRRIPRIVHVTGKTGCLTQAFHDNVNKWKFDNYSFYFHDDEAVDRLLFDRDWPMFPQIKNTMECIKDAGGAAKADLWRLLVLWEYGGIYTDMDNAPGKRFNGSTITPDTDAFFLQERGGFPSQWFFATSPRHPIMYLAMNFIMWNVGILQDIGGFNVPRTTGPNVIKNAFLEFMGFNPNDPFEVRHPYAEKYAYPSAGTYTGKYYTNHTVTIVGNRRTNTEWVQRDSVRGKDKRGGFKSMNITDYRDVNKKKRDISCSMFLYELYN